MPHKNQLDLMGKKVIKNNDDLYQVVDFLNKNLKSKDLIFGLSRKDNDHMEITIYQS